MKYAAIIYTAIIVVVSLLYEIGWGWVPGTITPTTGAIAGGALLIAYAVSRRR